MTQSSVNVPAKVLFIVCVVLAAFYAITGDNQKNNSTPFSELSTVQAAQAVQKLPPCEPRTSTIWLTSDHNEIELTGHLSCLSPEICNNGGNRLWIIAEDVQEHIVWYRNWPPEFVPADTIPHENDNKNCARIVGAGKYKIWANFEN
jgi:hypothetical protein